MSAGRRDASPFPDKEEVRRFIVESPERVGKREIARAFSITSNHRARLRELLRELREEGIFSRSGNGKHQTSLPNVTVIEIVRIDTNGELCGRPDESNTSKSSHATIYVSPDTPGRVTLGVGDRVLAKLKRLDESTYQALPIRVLDQGGGQLVGVFASEGKGGRIQSVTKRGGKDHLVTSENCTGAKTGELVLAERLPGRHYGLPLARVQERIGDLDGPHAISLIAIHANFIPNQFSDDALAQARTTEPATLGTRSDLRALPLITIDGAGARDFDDAVWAEADPDPANPCGWHILVAIADVAHYVPQGSALDHEARERGNSVYFPDRVVPMLPEALSNGLCSLKPGKDRACLAVHIYISAEGEIRRHEFVRGLMRSAARLEYGQVQRALDGQPDDTLVPIMAETIEPLHGAYKALLAARRKRGVLEFDLPEREVRFADDGSIERIAKAPRFDSHKLIEEFMIAANVAAAETLEVRSVPCVYRVHDQPDTAKLEELREILAGFGLKLSKSRRISSTNINHILAKAAESPHRRLINKLVLRAQARAEYTPSNFGHFGLALDRYTHFTSPIRRYADLLVHRTLISALSLGGKSLPAGADTELTNLCAHISGTERRAISAERDAMDRYAAAYLSTHIGVEFTGRISGVARFGVFVELDETGVDGFVPARSLGGTRPRYDPTRHSLSVGAAHVKVCDRVLVRLIKADGLTGSTLLELLTVNEKIWPPRNSSKIGKRGRRRKK